MKKVFFTLILVSGFIFCEAQCHKLLNKDVIYNIGRPSEKLPSGYYISGTPRVFFSNALSNKVCYNVDVLFQTLKSSKKQDFAALLTLYFISKEPPSSFLTIYNTTMNSKITNNGFYTYNEKVVKEWRKNDKKADIDFWSKWRDTHTKNGKIIKKND